MRSKFLTLLAVFSLLAVIGCQNDSNEEKSGNTAGFAIPAEYQGSESFSLGLGYIPNHVKAVALFCSYNNFELSKINGSKYIINIANAKAKDETAWFAEWKFENITFDKDFWFQIVPMADGSETLDDTWWHYAISGHPDFHQDSNNIVVKFKDHNAVSGCMVRLADDTYREGAFSTTDFTTWTITHNETISDEYWMSNFPCYKTHEERFYNANRYTECYEIHNPESN